jgi:hypothetical protein
MRGSDNLQQWAAGVLLGRPAVEVLKKLPEEPGVQCLPSFKSISAFSGTTNVCG